VDQASKLILQLVPRLGERVGLLPPLLVYRCRRALLLVVLCKNLATVGDDIRSRAKDFSVLLQDSLPGLFQETSWSNLPSRSPLRQSTLRC
jgi:hypothetical protein